MTKQKQAVSKTSAPKGDYTPTPEDKALVRRHRERRKRSGQVPKVRIDHQASGPAKLEVDHRDGFVGATALSEAFGTAEWAFASDQLNKLVNAIHTDRSAALSEAAVNGALAALSGIEPEDEVEALLATQMVATNHAAMELIRRAVQAEYASNMNAYGNLAVKFLRTFSVQLEGLQRYRGKGQQKIVVERVNVGEGGQAIVGSVERGGCGFR